MRSAAPMIPPLNRPLAPTEIVSTLKATEAWSKSCGEFLVDFDTEASQIPEFKATDLTLAFVMWTSADAAISEAAALVRPHIAVPKTASGDPFRTAHELLWQPLSSTHQGVLAAHIPEAIAMIESLIESSQAGLHATRSARTGRVMLAEHMVAARTLSKELDIGAAEVSRIEAEMGLFTATTTPQQVADMAARAASLRADLETSAAERGRLLGSLAQEAAHLEELRQLEVRAKELSALTMTKFTNPPRLGILSVDALGPTPPVPDLESLPWPAVRSQLATRAERLSRAHQALSLVIDRHENMFEHRTSLRGLVDGYRAKATAGRIGESAGITLAYEEARRLLWTSPCDIDAAQLATDKFVRLVTSTAPTASAPVSKGRTS